MVQNCGVTCCLHFRGSQEIVGCSETLSLAKIQEDHRQFQHTSAQYRSCSPAFDLQIFYAFNVFLARATQNEEQLTGGESGS